MKNGKKPTREERKLIELAGFDTYEWLVFKNTSTELHIVSTESGKTEIIVKSDYE